MPTEYLAVFAMTASKASTALYIPAQKAQMLSLVLARGFANKIRANVSALLVGVAAMEPETRDQITTVAID
jgi:hypothetical protein